MRHPRIPAPLLLLAALLTATAAGAHPREELFTKVFPLGKCNGFSNVGENDYMVIDPGHVLRLEGDDDGEHVELVITVLDQIEVVAGVATRVVEERESKDGELVEVSRNFLARCNANDNIFYFGEDVDIYEDGVIVSHDGAWRVGSNGAKAGVLMPGQIFLGSGYYQEVAPGVAEDRARILSRSDTFVTPAGTFHNVLVTDEDSALSPGHVEKKRYARGTGLIQDSVLLLVDFHPAP